MAKAYYGSRFSPNMTQTPEGFLICHNVPIARTGWYEYLGQELGLEDKAGEIVHVYRGPEEVFNPAAIASFEGKVLTDDHPPVEVTPENARQFMLGVTQNVRQGSGENIDLLIADLVAYDETLINEIRSGKREVSCGYECVYVDRGDGTYEQTQICGNHVAVVQQGRAGDRVAIKDSKTNPQSKGAMEMNAAKKLSLPKQRRQQNKRSPVKDFLAAVGLKAFAVDAEPEEVMDAIDALAEEQSAEDDDDDDQPTPPAGKEQQSATDDDPKDPALAALEAKFDAKFDQIMQALSKQSADNQGTDPQDPIDAAIAELEGQQTDDDNDEEESHTINAESMDEAGPVTDPEDRPQDVPTADTALKIQALKAMKPMLAEIKDPAAKKRAADAAIKAIIGTPTKKTYGKMSSRQKPTNDQKTATQSQAQDNSQLGLEWAKQHNPHYKNRA